MALFSSSEGMLKSTHLIGSFFSAPASACLASTGTAAPTRTQTSRTARTAVFFTLMAQNISSLTRVLFWICLCRTGGGLEHEKQFSFPAAAFRQSGDGFLRFLLSKHGIFPALTGAQKEQYGACRQHQQPAQRKAGSAQRVYQRSAECCAYRGAQVGG